jgi:UDP-N-acetylmuramate-alanine ligase
MAVVTNIDADHWNLRAWWQPEKSLCRFAAAWHGDTVPTTGGPRDRSPDVGAPSPATALNDEAQVRASTCAVGIAQISSPLPPTAYVAPTWALDLAGQHHDAQCLAAIAVAVELSDDAAVQRALATGTAGDFRQLR